MSSCPPSPWDQLDEAIKDIIYGSASGCELKKQQTLEPKAKLGVTKVRPRQGQILESTGVESKGQRSWESDLELTGGDMWTGRNPGEARRGLRNTSNKAVQQGSRTQTRRMGKEPSSSSPKARAPWRASLCIPSWCVRCFWEGRMWSWMLSDLGLSVEISGRPCLKRMGWEGR